MATSNSSSTTVNLKLMIDKKPLFAEAGKDFVDFLFTLLSLPVGTVIRLLSKDANNESNAKKFYMYVSSCKTYPYTHSVSDDPKAICPQCHCPISNPASFVAPAAAATTLETSGQGRGYVRGVAMYMIMDDLEVKPTSTISSITLFNNFNVKDVGTFEERVVPLDMDKV
ncbi:hypothetical protein M0R45_037223 [Rubus argutus]|uniref:Nucleic acid-binding protein n=1 Tax=Rubus argutus TaxID=59490 RepID=A0AAW1W3S7_RUBAR